MDAYRPVKRHSLANGLGQRIREMIQERGYAPGARLPAISEMARRYGVGLPTLREALRRLEAVGLIEIRHGSGVYVGRAPDTLLLPNPVFGGQPSKKLLSDLVEARIPIELETAALAARHAADSHLLEMRRLLQHAADHLTDPEILTPTNLGFHQQIALASGNAVLYQVLEVLSRLFEEEQRALLDIHGSWELDYQEHLGILEAIERRDESEAAARMRTHLEGLSTLLTGWEPQLSTPSE